MNILSIVNRFKTEKDCIQHLESVRWPKGPECPYCTWKGISSLPKENRHHCNKCNRSFSVTVGTIFHHSHLPLQTWFLAISLVLNAKKGLSSRQLARDLQINVKTAWRITMKLREAMKYDGQLLSGIIEMDETYVGGAPRGPNDRKKGKKAQRGKRDHKTPVVGAVSRDGKVVTETYSKRARIDSALLNSFVKRHVAIGTDTIILTDQHAGYNALRHFISHISINHRTNFAEPHGVNTNTIESFWAIVKRGIIGQYHKVSEHYLHKYLDEFSYRYNHRDLKQSEIFNKTIEKGLFIA